MIPVLLILCGSWFDVDDVAEPVPPPAPPTPSVCSCGCGRAECKCGKASRAGCAAEAMPTKKRVVIYSPAWCSACHRLRAGWKAQGWEFGDADVEVEWREETSPHATAYPFCFDPVANVYLTYRTDGKAWTPENVRKFVGLK